MDLSNKLLRGLANKLSNGLQRRAVGNAAEWAMKYRMIDVIDTNHPNFKKWLIAESEEERLKHPVPKVAKPFNFKHHPWSYEMHKCTSPVIVGQKAAQMAFSETCINKVFYANDILGETVLYVLPTKDNASDFSNGRFDPALEVSPHLQDIYSDVKNVGLKRAGSACLYIRGSNSRSALKSIPAGYMIFDEVDEMDTTQIVLAFERMMGQDNTQCFLISTPSHDNVGINYFFKDSSQDHFMFKCPHCNQYIEMQFDLKNQTNSSLVITSDDPADKEVLKSYYKCTRPSCQGVLPHESKIDYINLENSLWVPKYKDRVSRGFHVNQFNSHARAASPSNMAITFLRSLTSPEEEQEFYNNKLGITHSVAGAQISDEDIKSSIGSYTSQQNAPRTTLVTMGIDVGASTHYYEIDEWYLGNNSRIRDINLMTKCKVIKVGTTDSFDELRQLFVQYNTNFAVIDAQPQVTLSKQFCQTFEGLAKMCYYKDGGISRKDINAPEDEYSISVDRTLWLDVSLGRFKAEKTSRITIPRDTPLQYKDHLKVLVRTYLKDRNGNPIGRYVKGAKEHDHYAHARNYAEIALPFAVSMAFNKDIKDIL